MQRHALSMMLASAVLASAVLASGCAVEPDAPDPQTEFEESLSLLDQEYQPQNSDHCEALSFWSELGTDALHSGYCVGVEGVGVLGPVTGFGGYDIVWDLYHQELTVSKYAGPGVAIPELGASVSLYGGVGFGFAHGVADWDGYFITATAEFGLPFLKKFAHLEAAGFVSAIPDDQGGLDPLVPPDGVYGFTFGASLGVGVDLIPAPIGGNLTEGLWSPHKTAIRHIYDKLARKRIFGIRRLAVRLVDHHSGEPCDPNWPATDGEQECIVALGNPDATPAKRSVDVAYSICALSGGCLAPLAFQMATAALAIGTYRTHGHDVSEGCPAVE